MAAATRFPIVLDRQLKSSLDTLARSRTAPARQRRNAHILLLRSAHVPVRETARRAGCSADTVCRVCRRFHDAGWQGLATERPRGAPQGYPEERRRRVIEWAQTSPQALGLPITRWSLSWLQCLWKRLLGTRPPARETLRRWLRAAGIPWFRHRSFCRSNDPDFTVKCARICDAYRHAPGDWAVLCYDQKPHLQAISRRHRPLPPARGQPAQHDHDYRRHGTLCLHALLDVRTGRCWHACRADHKQETIARLLRGWLAARPQRKIILVLDNLSANHARRVREALDGLGKLVLVFTTPTYSSWLNQVERVFADLQRELLDHCQAWSVAHLGRQIRRWFATRNAVAKPYNWTFAPVLS